MADTGEQARHEAAVRAVVEALGERGTIANGRALIVGEERLIFINLHLCTINPETSPLLTPITWGYPIVLGPTHRTRYAMPEAERSASLPAWARPQ